MCRNATSRSFTRWAAAILLVCLSAANALSQIPENAQPEQWRRIGNASIEMDLPSVATGPVQRVWFSDTGSSLFAQTLSGAIWRTNDFERWSPAAAQPPESRNAPLGSAAPEADAQVRRASATGSRWYSFGRFVYRSDDGQVWSNVSAYRNQSILGGRIADLAISPADADDIVVSNAAGVWRSLDGGATWSGLNDSLPALRAPKLLALPNGLRPARLVAGEDLEIEWEPGERIAWRASGQDWLNADRLLRAQLSSRLGATIVTARAEGDWIYAGSSDGRLWVTSDRGQNWQPFTAQEGGAVTAFYINPNEPRIAIAAFAARGQSRSPLVLRTANGGRFWDDVTANLPAAASATGVTADPGSGAIYVSTTRGVFQTTAVLNQLGAATSWSAIGARLPAPSASDIRLDEGGNQLYVVVEGWGLFAAMAPHRVRQLSIVNSADFSSRPAAPGSLLSILGANVSRVQTGELAVPVLASGGRETQIQVPFEAAGATLDLVLEAQGAAATRVGLPLARVSPAIFIARDGAPLLLDADSGLPLDAANPARSGARIQILAAGLGAVEPAWPTGVPAPAMNPPRVAAQVQVVLDREPLAVSRATLAPGYVGFYLVEVQLPKLLNAGPAELFLEAGGRQSNRVRLYVMP